MYVYVYMSNIFKQSQHFLQTLLQKSSKEEVAVHVARAYDSMGKASLVLELVSKDVFRKQKALTARQEKHQQ